MNDFHHKKSLGQHFLTDKNIVQKIVRIADVNSENYVWEVGPGKGILTEELIETGCKLTAFEIDEKLYPILEEEFSGKINLVKQDVLKANWNEFFPKDKVTITANLPYQITSPFLFKVASFADKFAKIVIMVQKEVAQRINASVGTKDYSILSIKMQYYFDVSYEFTVKPHLFFPRPKVDSAVIKLIPRTNKPTIEDEKFFWRIVEVAFRNRRKMLRNNLKEILNSDQIVKLSEEFEITRRGETLTEIEFVELYDLVSRIKKRSIAETDKIN
jgi:16S rRNA (adenine1518-N6/adenine1519-N6)-dimethyltransferase